MRRLVFFVSVLFVASAQGTARADDPSAKALFQQGVALFNRGDTEAACSKFEQSYGLDPATGTLFNLASCHAKQGRYWIARREFLKLANEMENAGKTDKAEIARQKAHEAAQHLPKLSFQFPSPSNVDLIRIDGKRLAQSRWQSPIPVRSGRHVILFAAEGMQPQRLSVSAGGEGAIVNVAVPALTAAPSEQAPAPASSSNAPAVGGEQAQQTTSSQSWWTTQRTIGVVAGGAGVIAIGVGAFYGLTAISQKSTADSACGGSGGNCTSQPRADAANHDVQTADGNATKSDIGLGIGIAALAVGAYLVLTGAPASPPADTASIRVGPEVGPGNGGFSLSGRF
jgi:hypothetical protein